ncbi:hypothetical protein DFH11DRAFT_278873 [Phellopilus nigrolimitatus]|nr:hypothetical protein DFH11DRAFT_278873 [Phellopilus nigrolimitatus]
MSYPPPTMSPPVYSAVAASPEELVAHSNKVAEVLFTDIPRAPATHEPLRLPFCLPQMSSGGTSTFVRAYSRELHASGVKMDDWLRFIDGLNIAMTASPPLRIVDAAGLIIGFVPHYWAALAGAGMQFGAQVGIKVLSKTLTDRYMRRANTEYFAPRGLRARICKTAAVRLLVGLDAPPSAMASTSSKFKQHAKTAGEVAETVALHLPVIRKVYNRLAPPVPAVDPNAPGDMTSRRLSVLQGYVLPLSSNVPPPAPLEGLMQKASGLGMRLDSWKVNRTAASADRNRRLLAIQEGRATRVLSPPVRSPGSSQKILKQALDRRGDRRRNKDERRALRRRTEKSSRKLQTKVKIADRKEWKTTDNLLWVVLVNAEQDALIQGTESADGSDDVEQVSETEWREEIKREQRIRGHQRRDEQNYIARRRHRTSPLRSRWSI